MKKVYMNDFPIEQKPSRQARKGGGRKNKNKFLKAPTQEEKKE